MAHEREHSFDAEAETGSRDKIAVLVITSPRAAAIGLAVLMRESPSVQLVAETPPGAPVLSAARNRRPGLVVISGDGIREDLLRLLDELRRVSPHSKLIVCTDQVDAAPLRKLEKRRVEGIVAWADVTREFIHGTIEVTARGGRVRSAAIAEALSAPAAPPHLELTAREQAVLHALATMETQKEIAASLGISERTLHDIVASIKLKLDERNPYMLGAWGLLLGHVDVGEKPE